MCMERNDPGAAIGTNEWRSRTASHRARGDRVEPQFLGCRLLLFELGPYPGDGGDVSVVEGIDEIFLHLSFERPPDCLGEVPSALGEADERYPAVALVGGALGMSGG